MNEWQLLPIENNDWGTFLFGFNFFVFVLLKVRFKSQFFSFMRLVDTNLFFNTYGNHVLWTKGWTYAVVLFVVTTLSMFFSFWAEIIQDVQWIAVFPYLWVGIALVVGIRYSLVQFLGWLTQSTAFLNTYQFKCSTYLFRVTVFLFLGLALYFYPLQKSLFFLEILGYSSAVLYILSQAVLLRRYLDYLTHNGLYFILYLCTLKLSPWLLILLGLEKTLL